MARYTISTDIPTMYVLKQSNYGCMHILLDFTLIILTGGLWLIWIIIREMRR